MQPVTVRSAAICRRAAARFSAYQWQNLRLDLGITNLLDKVYYPPLGGVNIYKFWSEAAFPFFPPFTPVPGQGRSVNAGVTMSF